jgi:hypothetical protein
MKVGDLVREVTCMNRVPEIGIVVDVAPKEQLGAERFLVEFSDGADWMAEHHCTDLSPGWEVEVIHEIG